jgi:hypothetical protein
MDLEMSHGMLTKPIQILVFLRKYEAWFIQSIQNMVNSSTTTVENSPRWQEFDKSDTPKEKT